MNGYMLAIRHPVYMNTDKLNINRQKRINHRNSKCKKAAAAIRVSDKADFKSRKAARDEIYEAKTDKGRNRILYS